MRRPGNNINAQHYDIMFDENAIIYEDIFPEQNQLYICSIVQYSGQTKNIHVKDTLSFTWDIRELSLIVLVL